MQLRTIFLTALAAACTTSLGSAPAKAQASDPALVPPQPVSSPAIAPVAPPKAPGAGLSALKQAASDAEGDPARQAAFAKLVDGQASLAELQSIYAEGDGAPGFGLVAAKLARVYAHSGETAKAREAAEKALAAGAGGRSESVRLVLERLAMHDQVRPGFVGVILPLSGKFKGFGEAVRDGIALASKGSGVELAYKDSQGDPELAVKAVEQLVRDGAVAIIGPVGTLEAGPAAARAQELGVPMVSLARTEGIPQVGNWIFRNALTYAQQGRALARYAHEVMGTKAAAVLRPDIPNADEVTAAFWEAFEKSGGEVVAHETYAQDQTTFSRQVKRLVLREDPSNKAELREEAKRIRETETNSYKRRKALEKLASQMTATIDYDVLLIPESAQKVGLVAPALAVEDIFTNGCDEKAIETIKKTQKRDEIRTVTLLGTNGWNSPELVTRGGRYVICSVFVDGFHAASNREPTRKFVADFQEQYQRKPTIFEAQGFDTASIVREIVQRERPSTREAFRSALERVRRFPGAMGDTTFGPDRDADRPLFFLTAGKNRGIEELDVPFGQFGKGAK